MPQNPSSGEREPEHALISFSPASGIGFYQRDEEIYSFDLLSEEQVRISPTDGVEVCFYEFDQIASELSFRNLQDLLKFTRRTYLRDKKNTFYWVVCTERLAIELFEETLNLLNSEDLEGVEFSNKVVDYLQDKADPDRVFSVIDAAERLELRSVQRCLTHELRSIVFEPSVLTNRVAMAVAESPERSGRYLELLANCLSMVEELPRNALSGFYRLSEIVERRLAYLRVPEMDVLNFCFNRVGVASPSLNVARAMLSGNGYEVRREVMNLLKRTGGEGLENLVRSVAQLDPQPNNLLLEYGHRMLTLASEDQPRFLRHPGFMLDWFKARESAIPAEFEADLRRLSNEPAMRRIGQDGVLEISIDDKFLDVAQPQRWYAEYLSHAAFLCGFYADPAFGWRLLQADVFQNPRRWDEWLAFLLEPRRREFSGEMREDPIHLARARVGANILSLILFGSAHFDALEAPPIFYAQRMMRYAKQFLRQKDMTGPPGDIYGILANNVLVWAYRNKSSDLIYQATDLLRETGWMERNASPFCRIVI